MTITTLAEDRSLELELRRLQLTPVERTQLSRGGEPFSLAKWQEEAPPATAEELLEMDELLCERLRERESALAHDSDPLV
ncbi:MAG: hypothetical protein LC772_11150 [Chloroflexi bacterium]|nr:hypothetical protein [Chloroflexota bacterium]